VSNGVSDALGVVGPTVRDPNRDLLTHLTIFDGSGY